MSEPIKMSEPIAIQRSARIQEALLAPGFCRFPTDHTVLVDWDAETGWSEPLLSRSRTLELDATAKVFHYGQAIFEGLKAFRRPDGTAALFRVADHAIRMRKSAERLAMPEMPVELFVAACTALVDADQAWVPDEPGLALYLRPFMVATEPGLGLASSGRYRCTFLAYPAAPSFGDGVSTIAVRSCGADVRAVRGGTGEAKCAGNYGASLRTRGEALAQGYQEVLWLDGLEHRWIEELSGMNVFFVWQGSTGPRLTTPDLGGTIVRGITRDSLLILARELGFAADEKPTSIEDLIDGARSGRLMEMLACGTAASVVAVNRVGILASNQNESNQNASDQNDGAQEIVDQVIGDGNEGPITARLRQALSNAQYGPDPHGWFPRTGNLAIA